jgi:hypothetical protein
VAYDNVIDGAHQTTRGSSVVIPTQISDNYTVAATDQIILANAMSSLTVTLPTAMPVPLIPGTDASLIPPHHGGDIGRILTIKATNGSGGIVTVVPVSGQLIDGGTSVTLSAHQGVTLISDGSNWQIMSRS